MIHYKKLHFNFYIHNNKIYMKKLSCSRVACGYLEVVKDEFPDSSGIMTGSDQPIICIIHNLNGPMADPVA